MTKFTEGRHAGEGLLSEANFHRSRDKAVIKAGSGVVQPGAPLGKITAGGKFAPSPNASVAGIEGAEVATAIALYGCDATAADQPWLPARRPGRRTLTAVMVYRLWQRILSHLDRQLAAHPGDAGAVLPVCHGA